MTDIIIKNLNWDKSADLSKILTSEGYDVTVKLDGTDIIHTYEKSTNEEGTVTFCTDTEITPVDGITEKVSDEESFKQSIVEQLNSGEGDVVQISYVLTENPEQRLAVDVKALNMAELIRNYGYTVYIVNTEKVSLVVYDKTQFMNMPEIVIIGEKEYNDFISGRSVYTFNME